MSTKRILIVDDEERIREIVRACLEDLGGWETDVAESAQETLLKVATASFDAILLDVSMPDIDGLALYHKLQAQVGTRSIPVILLTAKALPSDQAQFAQIGVSGIITKPFDPVLISQQVADILGW
jgi:CheY-like chemotaxis protein